MQVVWKDVVGYEGLYLVSNTGLVKSNYRNKKVLSQKSDKDGYKGVALTKNKHVKHYRVHRLVAQAFIDNPQNLPIVNHKDLDVTNNNVSNLEWCTPAYNLQHYYATSSEKRTLSSLTKQEMLEAVSMAKQGILNNVIAAKFNLDSRADSITELVKGRRFSEVIGEVVDIPNRTTAKITDEIVLEILNEVYRNSTPQKAICEKYQMSPAQVSRIINGSRRREVYATFMTTFTKADS